LGAGLRIYPVPADDRLILEFPGVPGDKVEITVTDIIGREICREEKVASAMNRIEWDTRSWLPGAGFVKIRMKDQLLMGRYVIK